MRKLSLESIQHEFQQKIIEAFPANHVMSDDIELEWKELKDKAYHCASEVLGHVQRKHQDWFDDNDTNIQALLDRMHRAHLAWINDKSSETKRLFYTQARQETQTKLRQMKENWWCQRAEELQTAVDMHDMRRFYDGLRAIYGPQARSIAPIRTEDGATLLTERDQTLERWAEHFNAVLNRPSVLADYVCTR